MKHYKELIAVNPYYQDSQIYMTAYSQPDHQVSTEVRYMQQWVNTQDQINKPLLVVGKESSGKKSTLCSFIHTQSAKHTPNIVHITQFASVTPIYSNILYHIMTNLRNLFSIDQKVELNQEKLRRYFKYWLEITSDIIEKEYIGYDSKQKKKVVIAIEGIDLLVDGKGNNVPLQFWLPETIPKNIKIILTSNSISEGIKHKVHLMHITMPTDKFTRITAKFNEKVQKLVQFDLNLLELSILNKIVMKCPQFNPKSSNFEEIVKEYINLKATELMPAWKIQETLLLLSLNRKGLLLREIKKMMKIQNKQMSYFFESFLPLISCHDEYYFISHRKIKQVIKNLNKVDENPQKIKQFHKMLAKFIEKQPQSFRKMEELVYHLLESKDYLELKETISKIQNFILLYTPLTKNLLCFCWVKIEEAEQHDPVFQYNKALQSFNNHYYPPEEDLFQIIFQICMFFKEYSEFENYKTPEFKHPLIRGEKDQLSDINLYQEFKNMNMVKMIKQKHQQSTRSSKEALVNDEPQLKAEYFCKNKPIENPMRVKFSEDEVLSKIQSATLSKEDKSKIVLNERDDVSKLQLLQGKQQKVQIEELNITIESNQEKFRSSYLSHMSEYLQEYYLPMKKNQFLEKQYIIDFESESDQENQDQNDQLKQSLGKKTRSNALKQQVEKMKSMLILKTYREYLEENYHKSGEVQRYYYYKQWLWLQYPWICQSLKNNYSKMIYECMKSNTSYMSISKQFYLIKEVVRVIINTRNQSKTIYFPDSKDKPIDIIAIKKKNAKTNQHYDSPRKNIHTPIHHLDQPHPERGSQKQNIISYLIQENITDKFNSKAMRLDTTRIQHQIQQEIKLDESFKNKHYSQLRLKKYGNTSQINNKSEAESSIFMTSALENKQNILKDSSFLPILHLSKTISNSALKKSSLAKKYDQNSRDFTLIIRKYNQIKHSNEILSMKIQELKKITFNGSIQQEKEQLQNKIKKLQNSIENNQKKQDHEKQLKLRLNTIKQVCNLNTIYSSENQYLADFLKSLEFMINLEKKNNCQIKKQIENVLQAKKIQIKILKAEKKQIKRQKQIEKNKEKYDNLVSYQSNQSEILAKLADPKNIQKMWSQQSNQKVTTKNLIKLKPQTYWIELEKIQNLGFHYNFTQTKHTSEQKNMLNYEKETQESLELISVFEQKVLKLKEWQEKNLDCKAQLESQRGKIFELTQMKKLNQKEEREEEMMKMKEELMEKKMKLKERQDRKELLLRLLKTN